MPKQSREQILAELDARKIGYSDDMSYNELCEVLRKAQTEEVPVPKAEGPKAEEPIDYSNIRVGMETMQNHERRIVLLERALKKLSNG